MQIREGLNLIKGCTPFWSLKKFAHWCDTRVPVTVENMKENEIHTFSQSFRHCGD